MQRITPTFIEIDLEALRYNFRSLKRRLPPRVKSLCVVKSNAYGHGAIRISRVLQEEGADFFGTGTIDEGIQLREAGIKRPLLILMNYLDQQFESLLRYQLTPILDNLETAEALNSYLSHAGKKLPFHLKVDTGMTRLGILPEEIGTFCDRLRSLTCLEPVGLLSHLADAGEKKYTAKQERVFESARREFQERFPESQLYHLANSQATIDRKTSGASMARFGIALYGAYPLERDKKLIDLKPVLQWKTKVVTLKKVPPKTSVSYGRTFTTKKESLIGVVPVGYADGYPRLLSNQARVLVRGKSVPVVGTICMDMMMIDLTSIPGVKNGEEVVLIGRSGKEVIRAEELAHQAKTISYEIFCRIAERIPRVYR